MIRLEYDQQTDGIRVSFVVSDAVNGMTSASSNIQSLCQRGQSVGDTCEVPQGPDTLWRLKALLERVIECS